MEFALSLYVVLFIIASILYGFFFSIDMDASSQHCSEELDMAASSQLLPIAKAISSSCTSYQDAWSSCFSYDLHLFINP